MGQDSLGGECRMSEALVKPGEPVVSCAEAEGKDTFITEQPGNR